MKTNITGIAEAVAKLEEIGGKAAEAASFEVVASALAIQGEAKRILTDTEAVDTGRLRNSVAIAETESQVAQNSSTATGNEPGRKRGGSSGGQEAPNALRPGMLNAVIGSNVEYAPAIHFGTQGRAPRPFLVPALEAERPNLLRRLEAEVAKAVK